MTTAEITKTDIVRDTNDCNEWNNGPSAIGARLAQIGLKYIKAYVDVVETAERLKFLEEGLRNECYEVEQCLGKVLGYPKYRDDPKNFPDVTDDSVCIGEHTAGTLAAEAAGLIERLRVRLNEFEKGRSAS